LTADFEYGICRLPVIPVRDLPSDRSEQVTQLLFGEIYRILEWSENHKWTKIEIAFDGYQGWIDHLQVFGINQAHFNFIQENDSKICLEIVAKILVKNTYINILIGSLLPLGSQELFNMEAQIEFSGVSKSISERAGYQFLRDTALKYLNAPYTWGGKTPFGIDCSGFTQMVFKLTGYALRRDAGQQKEQGGAIEKWADRGPGDLIYLEGVGSEVPHVGILLEDDSIIHASGKVRIDRLDQTGIFNNELQTYSHSFGRIRRILK